MLALSDYVISENRAKLEKWQKNSGQKVLKFLKPWKTGGQNRPYPLPSCQLQLEIRCEQVAYFFTILATNGRAKPLIFKI
jgi:hypothetical protein